VNFFPLFSAFFWRRFFCSVRLLEAQIKLGGPTLRRSKQTSRTNNERICFAKRTQSPAHSLPQTLSRTQSLVRRAHFSTALAAVELQSPSGHARDSPQLQTLAPACQLQQLQQLQQSQQLPPAPPRPARPATASLRRAPDTRGGPRAAIVNPVELHFPLSTFHSSALAPFEGPTSAPPGSLLASQTIANLDKVSPRRLAFAWAHKPKQRY